MSHLPTFGTFFLPGPTEVRRPVLEAMLQPMIGHRDDAFTALVARLQPGLQEMFGSAQPVLVSSSSATGLMEAAVRCARPGPILSLVNGAFSQRFAHIARACDREVETLEVPWGATVPLEAVETALRARRFSALTVVHSESSTGALTDIVAVGELARAHGVLSLVDSVTGAGAMRLECDRWELDFVLTGSQKALALPPGLAFATVSERYLAHATEAPARGVYFDVVAFAAAAARHQTPNTPALSLLYALERQLADIRATGGFTPRFERHAAMASHCWHWVEGLRDELHPAFRVLAPRGARSPTVTAIVLPPTVRGTELARAVSGRGFTIGSGYGRLKDETFRIGHMGDHTAEGLSRCLDACAEALRELRSGT